MLAVAHENSLRSSLRMDWHHSVGELRPLAAGLTSSMWQLSTGTGEFVVQVGDPGDRPQLEAGLAALEQLRSQGLQAGRPVRTVAGALTAEGDAGPVAVLRPVPGRPLVGADPLDQHWWGDLLGAAHRALDGFSHPGLLRWPWLRAEAAHLDVEPWVRTAVAEAVAAMTRLTVTDRLTFGVLHGDPAPARFLIDIDTGRTGLVGWGPSVTGPLVYDLAAAVLYAGGPAGAGELVDGYTAAAPVSRDEVDAALPVLLRFRWAVHADRYARRLARAAARPESGAPSALDLAALHRARDELAALTAEGC